LTQPYTVVETVIEHEVREWEVVVQPKYGSICHADLRYYTGNRRPEALKKKLPMALIHEGVGTIVQAGRADLPAGRRVVIVPNIPGYLHRGIAPQDCCPICRDGKGDNYCEHGRFLGSGVDGIAQSRLVIPSACVIPIPDSVPDELAVLAELCSVSYQALSHASHLLPHSKIAVFGDGPVGYLTAATIRHVFNVDTDQLHVFGAIPEKVQQFDFAHRYLVQEYDFSKGGDFDVAVECTGGKFAESAINQAIDVLKPGGWLILLGVSEDRVPVNTRDILEKGITVRGSSRSSASDFPPVLRAMEDPACRQTLTKLLPEEKTNVSAAADFVRAMEEAAAHRGWKKTILQFNWEP
jgi:ribitol-5-phosphate 2-dehydrogenase